jgi:hypothetical protein
VRQTRRSDPNTPTRSPAATSSPYCSTGSVIPTKVARAVAQAREANPALGPQHPDTLASRHLVALLLDRLGQTDEALPIARAVAQAREVNPALGPQHPDTLASRYLVAQLLDRLGQTDEALPIARAVAQASEANPALGPQHPNTLASRNFVADLLARLREKPPNATAA